MNRKENFEKALVRDYLRFKNNAYHLCMAGTPGTNRMIGRSIDMPTTVARRNRFNTKHLLEHTLQTPETAAP